VTEADECERFLFDLNGILDADIVRFPREFLPVREIIVVEFTVAADTLRRLRTRREPLGELSNSDFFGDVMMALFDTTGELKEKNSV
jgi:hypothetical protein